MSLATERQRYLSLINNEEFAEALIVASEKGFDKELIFKKQIHLFLKKWETLRESNWLEGGTVDSSELQELIRKTQPSLLLYVCTSGMIPSKRTLESLLSFGYSSFMKDPGYDEEKMKFVLLDLKWRVFVKASSHVEYVECSFWRVALVSLFKV